MCHKDIKLTKHRRLVSNTLTSYLADSGLKSRPTDRILCLRFLAVFLGSSGKVKETRRNMALSLPADYLKLITPYHSILMMLYNLFLMARQPLGGLGRLIFRGFTITLFIHTTFGRTPLDEGQARRRDLYLTTHNTHNRQTSMPPVGDY
jgi:hypothetical protein